MSENGQNAPTDSGALLHTLFSNPDLIRNLSSMLGEVGTSRGASSEAGSAPPAPAVDSAMTDGISRVLSNPDMLAKLPDVMRMLAPMMQQASTASQETSVVAAPLHHDKEHDRRHCRNDLLLALKPFLSEERCRAVDMLLGLSRLGDALQKLI